jgi:hypothetical protein
MVRDAPLSPLCRSPACWKTDGVLLALCRYSGSVSIAGSPDHSVHLVERFVAA